MCLAESDFMVKIILTSYPLGICRVLMTFYGFVLIECRISVLWCLDGRVRQEGLRGRWDELVFPLPPLGPLRRKELEAKRTLFTRLSEMFIWAGGFGAQWQKNNTGSRGERGMGVEGGYLQITTTEIQYLVESCSHPKAAMSVTNATSKGFAGTRFQKEARAEPWLVSESERQSLWLSEVNEENFKEMMGLEY